MSSLQSLYTEPGENLVIEGLHALKHAIKLNTRITHLAMRSGAESNIDKICPELRPEIMQLKPNILSPKDFDQLSSRRIPTGFVALADKPNSNLQQSRPTIILENPRNLNNVGAVIRTLVAFNLNLGLLSSELDIFHPVITRTSAGLNFGLGFKCFTALDDIPSPIIGLDNVAPTLCISEFSEITDQQFLVFGSERNGLSPETRAACSELVEIPISDPVSSLSLPHSVAIVASRLV